jgi:SPP1 gp7 family putative phage head morphogenesis protein
MAYCCDMHTLADGNDKGLFSDDELESWVRKIYDTGNGTINHAMVRKLAEHYWQAVQAGIANANLGAPGADVLHALATNVFHFSAAKNYSLAQEITAIIQSNGRIREWREFLSEAKKLDNLYNKVWLKTEYDLALAGGTMVAKWKDFESTGQDTMLRYSTVEDARVRDTHRAMHGITLPLKHPFWNTNYPPNGYRCRCDVDRVPGAKATADKSIPGNDDTVPKIFQKNWAKEGVVLPDVYESVDVNNNSLNDFVNSVVPYNNVPAKLADYESATGITINKDIFNYTKVEIPLIDKSANFNNAYFDSDEMEVHIGFKFTRWSKSKWVAENLIYHEYGHAIDEIHVLSKRKDVQDLMAKYRKEWSANKNKLFKEIDKNIWDEIIKATDNDYGEQLSSLYDTLSSLNSDFGGGHEKFYWKIKGNSEAEFIAHAFENYYCENKAFTKHVPQLALEMKSLIENILKEIK